MTMKKLQVFLLAMVVLTSFSALATTNEKAEEKLVQVENSTTDKLKIDVFWEIKEEIYDDNIIYHYILVENKTNQHVFVYLVYTDDEGEHKITLHSQTWSGGASKTRVYTKGRAKVNIEKSYADYM